MVAEDTRRFVERLRRASSDPVVYAELPGAQHGFDLFHSIRFETVVDGIEAFTAWVRSSDAARQAWTGRDRPSPTAKWRSHRHGTQTSMIAARRRQPLAAPGGRACR